MKKTFRFVFAAVAVLAAASCAKEYVETLPVEEGNKVTFGLSLTGNPTKTDISEGKTLWAQDDSILFSNGSKTVKAAIPDEFVGKGYAEIAISDESIASADTVYAIYPPQAYKSAKGGVISLAVSNDQSGNFGDANICVAMAKDHLFEMSNATAVMKFSVPDGIETVVLNSGADDVLAGTLAATCSTENPLAVSASSPQKSIKVTTGGLGGDYYVAVVPGTFSQFSLMALALNGMSQKKETTDKTLAINDLADLGLIGNKLAGSSLKGKGTESNPFLIRDLADLTTLATTVNNGLSYEGQYFKVLADISDVSLPIGTSDQEFCGIFDGDNHTLTLAIGNDGTTDGDLGLFGSLGDGATVSNIKLAGAVTTTGDYVGALAGSANAGTEGLIIENITNEAVVKGANYVGGIVGSSTATTASNLTIANCTNKAAVTGSAAYVGGIAGECRSTVSKTISSCTNEGAITGLECVGGLVGTSYFADLVQCQNNGEVKSTSEKVSGCYYNFNAKNYTTGTSGVFLYGTGGIIGAMQNGSIKNCVNNAAVNGFFKVAGVVGVSHWGNIQDTQNNGKVTATAGITSSNPGSQTHFSYGSLAGGIVGWSRTSSTIKNCTNTGEVRSKGGAGGILGYYFAEAGKMGYITNCKNSGNIITAGAYFGGVAGINPSTGGIAGKVSAVGGSGRCVISGCENTGEVVNNSYNTGGIIGEFHCSTTGSVQEVYKCVNKGNVTGPVYTGGIVGFCYSAYKQTSTIKNCANYGTIKSIRSNDGGDCAGGILGANHVQNDNNANYTQTINIYNCYNQGKVIYPAAHVKPYTGGIVGRWEKGTVVPLAGKIGNCYNAGFIGPDTEAAPAAGAENTLGGLVGSFEYAGTMNFSYYSAGACDENITAVGKASKALDETVTSYNEAGELGVPVVANEVTCLTLLEALNQWQNYYVKYDYFNWKAGAKGPEFDTTTD